MRIPEVFAFERIRAHELGEAVGLMRGGVPDRAHLDERYLMPALSELPGGFAAGEAAANDQGFIHALL
jgi:hypothetical protein